MSTRKSAGYGPNFNPINEEQREELIEAIQEHGLEELQDLIVDMARNCILFEKAAEQNFTTGCTQLGGLPDVPEGWSWPEGLVFLGQFNLAEIAPHDHNNLLPEYGLLSFFYAQEPMDTDYIGLPRHIYHFEDIGSLKQSEAPPGYLPVAFNNEKCIYTPVRVKPRSAISLPASNSRGWYLLRERAADDAYSELLNYITSSECPHQFLGHSAFMNSDADEDVWQATFNVSSQHIGKEVSQEEKDKIFQNLESTISRFQDEGKLQSASYYMKQRDAHTSYFNNKPECDASLHNWVLLFQMNSDDEVGAQFWDAGFAYFMIRRQDLAAKRFDLAYASLWNS